MKNEVQFPISSCDSRTLKLNEMPTYTSKIDEEEKYRQEQNKTRNQKSENRI